MGYGGNFMRADRSEASRCTASSAHPSALRAPPPHQMGEAGRRREDRYGEEKGSRAGRRRGTRIGRRRQPPLTVDGTKEAEVIALFDRAMADDADGSAADLLLFNMGNNAAVDVREMTAQHFED